MPNLTLVERLENATGPDRELDKLIHYYVNNSPKPLEEWLKSKRAFRYFRPYTSSLDAALTLVPDDFMWTCGSCNEDDQPWACITSPPIFDAEGAVEGGCDDFVGVGASAAIALCIASLRACSALTKQGE